MIYFLVNNNYHLIDAYEHCKTLTDYDKSLIQVPHTLDVLETDKIFDKIFTYNSPFIGLKNFFNIFKIKKTEMLINESLSINSDDILFLYTEYEVLNQYIISLFKRSGAKVYIIEDGGFPTYLTYGVKSNGSLPLKQQIKLLYLKYIIGYRFVEFLFYNKIVFPQINEKYIDAVMLYLDVPIVRNISKYLIAKNTHQLELDNKTAIFLNEKIYQHYCTEEEYKTILNDILGNLTNHFSKVYFKFHPRETASNKEWQADILQKYPQVEVIEDNKPIENLLNKYNAKFVFSFLSAALFNVNSMGAVPVYIYHKYEKVMQNSVFERINSILIHANYSFLDSYENLTEVGFDNRQKKNRYNLHDFTKKVNS